MGPLDLEVVYVGQAYGDEGLRRARDRLRSHETLQGIYAEAIEQGDQPDRYPALSEKQERSSIHAATFPLHSEADRRKMFDFAPAETDAVFG